MNRFQVSYRGKNYGARLFQDPHTPFFKKHALYSTKGELERDKEVEKYFLKIENVF